MKNRNFAPARLSSVARVRLPSALTGSGGNAPEAKTFVMGSLVYYESDLIRHKYLLFSFDL